MTKANYPFLLTLQLLLLTALLGYSLPWLMTPGVSMQAGAYDLAEWMSLHPFVRSTSLILLPALLLRLPLVFIGLAQTALIRLHRLLWLSVLQAVLVFGIALALFPPVEFFRDQFNDPNYRQIFIIWLVYGLSIITIFAIRRLPLRLTILALTLMGLVCGLWGLIRAYALMDIYAIPISIGLGGWIFSISSGMILFLLCATVINNKQRGSLSA